MQSHWKGVGSYATVGLELALSVLFGLFVGRWLDERFGTQWLALVGFGLGAAAGFRAVYRAVQRANRDAERAERLEKEARERYVRDSEQR